jgi:SAM-dependent methyltransferase
MTAQVCWPRTAGLRRIITFNWPKLIAASALIITSAVIASRTGGVIRVSSLIAASTTTYFLVASLAASWWVYDRSDLHTWNWLRPLLPVEPTQWVLLHVGFDESGAALPAALGRPAAVIDLSFRLGRITPSLRRAQQRNPADTTAVANNAWLPIRTGSLDAVLIVFAAHEIRKATARETLFDELRRVLRPTGRVVLVEHFRDLANISAFGSAAWHFQTRREWTRLAHRSGFDTLQEITKTAFVRGLALCSS